MLALKSLLLIVTLVTFSLAGILPPNYLFRSKNTPRNEYLNRFSENFDYPLYKAVNKTLGNISSDAYAAEFYTGYIPVTSEGSYIFYTLYPANGDTDAKANFNNSLPLVMWMQGGPGCADWIGNFGEIGPFHIVNTSDGGQKAERTPVNWNTGYNLLFIDQPPGVGFSPVSPSDIFNNSMQAGATVIQFLQGLFNVFTSLKASPFYIFGESYGGHYIPAVASQIVQTQQQTGLKLSGIGIGDGLTDPPNQGGSYAEFGFQAGFLDTDERDRIAAVEKQIPVEFKKGNFSGVAGLFDDVIGTVTNPAITGVNNPYDYRVDGAGPADPYTIYLTLDAVRQAWNLDPSIVYSDCSDPMYTTFYPDIGQSYAVNITYLLQQKIPVVLYNGQDDVIINTPGARNWIRNMGWAGIAKFELANTNNLVDSENNVLGKTQTYQNLAFVVVYKAGHTVPGFQPVAARLIIDGLITGKLAKADEHQIII